MANDYSAVSWTTSQLLADIRRKARLPDTSADYTDVELLRESTEKLWSYAGLAVSLSRDGRLSRSLDRVISSWARTTNNAELDLPNMAVADTIESVEWLSSSGSQAKALTPIPSLHEALASSPNVTGEPWGYVLLDGRIRLVPAPSDTAATVRFKYQRRHGELVSVVATGAVLSYASVASGTQSSVTLADTPPSGFATNARVDIMTVSHPHRLVLTDVEITGVSTNTLTFGSLSYAALAAVSPVGLTVALSGKTPYLHLPLEMRQSFGEYVAAAILRDLGDETAAQAYELSSSGGMGRVINAMNPRTKASREKVVNPHSHFRSVRRTPWGGGESW